MLYAKLTCPLKTSGWKINCPVEMEGDVCSSSGVYTYLVVQQNNASLPHRQNGPFPITPWALLPRPFGSGKSLPIGSMYGVFTYIWLIFMVNVGKYPIHGSFGL